MASASSRGSSRNSRRRKIRDEEKEERRKLSPKEKRERRGEQIRRQKIERADRISKRHEKGARDGQAQIKRDNEKRDKKYKNQYDKRNSRIKELEGRLSGRGNGSGSKKGHYVTTETDTKYATKESKTFSRMKKKGEKGLSNQLEKASDSVKGAIKTGDRQKKEKAELHRLRLKQKTVDSARKNKTDLLTRPVGSDHDLGRQRERRKAALAETGGSAKDAQKLLELEAKGGKGYTDEKKESFEHRLRGELSKSYSKEAGDSVIKPDHENRADRFIEGGPKLKRVAEAERTAKNKELDEAVVPKERDDAINFLESIDEKSGKSRLDMLEDNGFTGIGSKFDDGVFDKSEIDEAKKEYDAKGPDKLNDIVVDGDNVIYKVENKNTGVKEDVVFNRASRQAFTKAKSNQIEAKKTAKIAKRKVESDLMKAEVARTASKLAKKEAGQLKTLNSEIEGFQKEIDEIESKGAKSNSVKTKLMESKIATKKIEIEEIVTAQDSVSKIKTEMATLGDKLKKAGELKFDDDEFESESRGLKESSELLQDMKNNLSKAQLELGNLGGETSKKVLRGNLKTYHKELENLIEKSLKDQVDVGNYSNLSEGSQDRIRKLLDMIRESKAMRNKL
tara:strand:- start:3698 stop:5557 length:1860 start_codon:yes stop_codon:yes gene_type:complete